MHNFIDIPTGLKALHAIPTIELLPLVGIPAYWLVGFVIFCGKCLVQGVPRTERILKTNSRVLPYFIQEYGYWMFGLPVRALVAMRVTPNLVTILSLIAAAASGTFFALGRFSLGGWMLAASAGCDALDGMVARATGVSSDRGEFFDSVVDRYSDFFVSLGLLFYYRNDLAPTVIIALGIIGSQVMGYAKAKGEAVGIDPKIGWMQRHERCFYLICATCLSPIVGAFIEPYAVHPMHHLALFVLATIAIFTNMTSVARAAYVMKRMDRRPARSTPAVVVAVEERSHMTPPSQTGHAA